MAKANLISGKVGGLLDRGVAALAAVSAAFVTYAMPEGLFARLILASHIPDFVAAAHPPLGAKARLAVIAAVGLLVYAFVWTLMRALDSIGAPRPTAKPAEVEEEEAPRLRRADAHPDAPSRRPIRAGRDLGEPAFDDEEPFELGPDSAIGFDHDAEPEHHDEPGFHEPVASEPWHEVAPEPEQEPAPEPVRAAAPLPSFLAPQQPEEEPEHAPAARPAFVPPSFDAHDDAEEEEPEEEEADSYPQDEDNQSLARLMRRFESGLGRKQQALDPASVAEAEEPAPKPQPVPSEVGHRLRNAITDLGKISAPGR